MLCCVLGIPAIIVGKQEMNNIDQGLAPVEGRGLAQAGFILGIVSLASWGALLVLEVLLGYMSFMQWSHRFPR